MTVDMPSENEISVHNCVNLGAYLLTAVVTYTADFVRPLDDIEMSKKYQTLITPAGVGFAIWGIIFMAEFVFVVAQFFPAYRNTPLVRTITPYWVSACVFQSVWNPLFGFEVQLPALLCMYGICASLSLLILHASPKAETLGEELLLLTGLGIHCGWIVLASALGTNVYFVSQDWRQAAQLSVAISSLAVACAAAVVFVVFPRRCQNFWVPLVVSWAAFFIGRELDEAKYLKDEEREYYLPWNQDIIDGVRGASDALVVVGLLLAVAAVALRVLTSSQFATVTGLKASEDGRDVALSEHA